jgi:hypothetical protein
MKYGFTFNKFPVKANDVGAYFEQIQQERGDINPKYIVEKARDKSNLLHNVFEWDDSIAAEAYRIDQARCLIRSLVVIVDDNKETGKDNCAQGGDDYKSETRAVVSVSFKENQPKSYYTIDKVINSDYAQSMLLKQALRDIEIFKEKYRCLKELACVFASFEKAKNKIIKTEDKRKPMVA